MKIAFFTLILYFLAVTTFAQAPKTAVIERNSGGGLIKEIYLVREDNKDIKEGTYHQFFKDSLITHGRYTDDKKSGVWNFFDYSGKLNFSGNYTGGLKDGKWVCTLNGKISSELYYSTGKTDSIFGFFENGNQAVEVWKYADGSGMIKTYYDNGNIKEEQPTQNGKPHGTFRVYFKNGRLHREVLYENAVINTVLKTFDMSGKAIDGGNLENGNGNLVAYYLYDSTENMEMKKFCFLGLTNGTVNGTASFYYENGNLESSGIAKSGYTEGEWKFYLDDGNIKYILNYNYSPFSEDKNLINAEIYSATSINIGQRNPEFQGGEETWLSFLANTVRFPNGASEFPSVGIVYIDFMISDIGQVSSSKVVKSINKALDDEALRVITEMPRWNPGLRYGIPVGMMMNMPLSFNIE